MRLVPSGAGDSSGVPSGEPSEVLPPVGLLGVEIGFKEGLEPYYQK